MHELNLEATRIGTGMVCTLSTSSFLSPSLSNNVSILLIPRSYSRSFGNAKDSRTDAVIDLVYFTLAHLRRPTNAALNIPKGNDTTR